MKHIVIFQEHLPHYRVAFFERLRERLEQDEIHLDVVFNRSQSSQFVTGNLPWARMVRMRRFCGFVWHCDTLMIATKADLVIAAQEVKYPVPILLHLYALLTRHRFAFWGHGRNFQAENPNSVAERFKRWLSKRVDWWFAYNDLSARVVRDLGFPAARITSVGNAVDVAPMVARRAALTSTEIGEVRDRLGIDSENVAVYTGGLYSIKRIGFLLTAANLIREAIPDFHLLIIGDGPDRKLVADAAAAHPWIHYLSKLGDQEKVPYWALAKVSLMPGAVGLVIFDCFALGVPIVTTDISGHGPEIECLKNGVNGVIVGEGQDPARYASAVVALLRDPVRLRSLIDGGQRAASEDAIGNMVNCFAEGVISALEI